MCLHSWEERAVKKRRFEVAKSWSHISGHPEGSFVFFQMFLKCCIFVFLPLLPEVRILVDGTGDEAGHSLLVTKDEREGRGKARSCLNSWKTDLPNWTAVVKTKNALHLVVRHTLLDLDNVLIERRAFTHESEVCEDEGFFNIESKRNDVFDILPGQAHRLLLLQVLPQELLVVCHLDHQGHIEGVLSHGPAHAADPLPQA